MKPFTARGELDYTSLSDQQVVQLAADGSERAFRELIGRYQRPVFSLIYRLVRDREREERARHRHGGGDRHGTGGRGGAAGGAGGCGGGIATAGAVAVYVPGLSARGGDDL